MFDAAVAMLLLVSSLLLPAVEVSLMVERSLWLMLDLNLLALVLFHTCRNSGYWMLVDGRERERERKGRERERGRGREREEREGEREEGEGERERGRGREREERERERIIRREKAPSHSSLHERKR